MDFELFLGNHYRHIRITLPVQLPAGSESLPSVALRGRPVHRDGSRSFGGIHGAGYREVEKIPETMNSEICFYKFIHRLPILQRPRSPSIDFPYPASFYFQKDKLV